MQSKLPPMIWVKDAYFIWIRYGETEGERKGEKERESERVRGNSKLS